MNVFDKRVLAVITFIDGDGKAFDGAEYPTTWGEVCMMHAYPRKYHYDVFYIYKVEENKYYCNAIVF